MSDSSSMWSSLFAASVARIISNMGGPPRTNAGWDALSERAWDEADAALEAHRRAARAAFESKLDAVDPTKEPARETEGTYALSTLLLHGMRRIRDRHVAAQARHASEEPFPTNHGEGVKTEADR